MSTTASQAALGYGATFSTGVTVSGTTTYTPISELSSINFEGFTVNEIDVTHLQSPNAIMESIPSLLKPGRVSLQGNYIGDTSQQSFTTLAEGRTIFPWQITTTLGSGKTYTLTGQGFVAKLSKGPFAADKKVDYACDIQCSGAFTETVA